MSTSTLLLVVVGLGAVYGVFFMLDMFAYVGLDEDNTIVLYSSLAGAIIFGLTIFFVVRWAQKGVEKPIDDIERFVCICLIKYFLLMFLATFFIGFILGIISPVESL